MPSSTTHSAKLLVKKGIRPAQAKSLQIPKDLNSLVVRFGARQLTLTNLLKMFWPELGITKRDLLQYYADISSVVIPHLRDRPMVMKRYPNGAGGDFFFMKHAPLPRPDWINICSIVHGSGNIIDFAIVQDLPSLLWLINLGCIDLNQWYARCDDVDRPDYLHFDLDPVPNADFGDVCQVALIVKETLDALKMSSLVKTTGSRGLHVYVPIVHGPVQKQVWTVAKRLAQELAAARPQLITAEYRIAKRPAGRVLVDYNQNAWGRTLASAYSYDPSQALRFPCQSRGAKLRAGFVSKTSIYSMRGDESPGSATSGNRCS
jgi:bifunctional non-homologous end joining protein LigD